MTPGSHIERLSWLPGKTLLFGGLLAGALSIFPQHSKMLFVGWSACVLGIVAAHIVGRFIPNQEQAIARALLETLVRPAFPLMCCVAVAVSVPVQEARVFATALVVFFLTMLTIDRAVFVASLGRGGSIVS